MQNNAVGGQQCGDAWYILNRSDFVVHRHCGDSQNISVQALFERTEVDESFVVNRNGLNRESLTHGKPPSCGQDAFVLDGTHEDTLPAGRRTPRKTKQGEVVGFSGSGGEDDFIGVGSDQGGDRDGRFANRFVCLPSRQDYHCS